MQTSIFYEARGSKNGVMRFHHILGALCLLTAMLLYDWWYSIIVSRTGNHFIILALLCPSNLFETSNVQLLSINNKCS